MVQKRRKPKTRWGSRLFLGAAFRFAVPDKIFGLTLFLDFIDRCTPMALLHLPPAAQRHWAKFSLASPVQIGISNKKSAIPGGMTVFIWWQPAAAICCYPVAVPCENFAPQSGLVFCRPLPLALIASSATGGAPIAPQIFTGFASSNRYQQQKISHPGWDD